MKEVKAAYSPLIDEGKVFIVARVHTIDKFLIIPLLNNCNKYTGKF